MKKILSIFLAALCVTACTKPDSQNHYSKGDVGKPAKLVYGTIVDKRAIDITHKNSGIGAGIGAAGGLAAGANMGKGDGQLATVILGTVIGAVVGGVAEQQLNKQTGFEYSVALDNGEALSIAQNQAEDDVPMEVGDRVMVQMRAKYTGDYMRILPAKEAPAVKKKKK